MLLLSDRRSISILAVVIVPTKFTSAENKQLIIVRPRKDYILHCVSSLLTLDSLVRKASCGAPTQTIQCQTCCVDPSREELAQIPLSSRHCRLMPPFGLRTP